MRLVLTGGGTGGHVYPALAIAEAFADEPAFAPLDVLFVGTRDRMEARIVPEAGLPIAFVRAAPFVRALSPALASALFANVRGFFEALAILHRARPDVLIATGGYVAFPVATALRAVRALRRSRARIAVLEPNAVRGLTNRMLAPLADEVWLGLAPAGRTLLPRERVTGTPVRASMRRAMSRAAAAAALGVDPARPIVVVMGGSQGARSINDAVAALVEAGAPAGWQFVAMAGARDFDALRVRIGARRDVVVLGYLDDPRAAYAAADVVVARAGASTLAELAATATPALLVPYPHATDDHQTSNARAYAAGGAARVVRDGDLTADRLRDELLALLDRDTLDALRSAARRVASDDPRATIVARVKALCVSNGRLP